MKGNWTLNRKKHGMTQFVAHASVEAKQLARHLNNFFDTLKGDGFILLEEKDLYEFGMLSDFRRTEIHGYKKYDEKDVKLDVKLLYRDQMNLYIELSFSTSPIEIEKLLNRIILEIDTLIVGSYFELDYYMWQNNLDISTYLYKDGLIFRNELGSYEIDRMSRPGYVTRLFNTSFAISAKNWFGPLFIDKYGLSYLLSFEDCQGIYALQNGVIFIDLFDIYDGDEPGSQQRQWNLRKHLKIDEVGPIENTRKGNLSPRITDYIVTSLSHLPRIYQGKLMVFLRSSFIDEVVEKLFPPPAEIHRTNAEQALEFVMEMEGSFGVQVTPTWCMFIWYSVYPDMSKVDNQNSYLELLGKFEECYLFKTYESFSLYAHITNGSYKRLVYHDDYELKCEIGSITLEERDLMEAQNKKLGKKHPFREQIESSNGMAWYLDDGFMEALCAAKCIDLRNPEQYGILDLAYITSYQPLIEPPTKPWWKFW